LYFICAAILSLATIYIMGGAYKRYGEVIEIPLWKFKYLSYWVNDSLTKKQSWP
jgi:hypothetical protein